ncbi:LLM class F420-dependent oxidoreductase [Microbacterium sp. dk485]|uniref:LLM class F420-dependent oxidoreductase n=1 Tax=Microbacterium wangchenii TaxID=2541726 RepID=A0ABX5SY95_9MICO|nr:MULTISPECIES: LLM class F420-dependent oxidoreductase [Microbacterium]MCK6068480.1 LLM class F420-dependent oxidoreductase [Microbacterium sp. EYE_512]QBR90782.1 LLM class F420-dependent oxidoreductase [Microbacterium wangchenii]TFV85579.1 LLM class F420-dependent oxidoreductase [Microbacterium sp. dk485]TXK09310.1 LLM class F420-dependent oxidoreductase [Microbacterium wangchenii]
MHVPRADRRVRIGAQVKPQHAEYDDIRRALAAAEETGVDVVFNWDHFFPLSGDPDGAHFEAWTMLAAWAESTERADLGVLVSSNSYRNPRLLADMARTVDHISDRGAGGRLILGIGAGWAERDHVEYGYAFGTPGDRLRMLEAGLAAIRDRWGKLNLAPTRQIPVLIGGGGEKVTLRIAARHADVWHGFGDAGTIAHKHAVLDGWCHQIGRDPADIERSAGVSPKPGRFAEDVDDYCANAEALFTVGTRLITVGLEAPRWDLGPLRDLVAWRDDRNRSRG